MRKLIKLLILSVSIIFVLGLCAACSNKADSAPGISDTESAQSESQKQSDASGEENTAQNMTIESENTTYEENAPQSDVQGGTASKTEQSSSEETQNESESDSSEETVMADDTPYSQHGRLSVNKTTLTDEHGDAFRLQGVSTHGIGWFPQYVNEDTFAELRDWGVNAVRLAMYTAEGGYCESDDANKDSLRRLSIPVCRLRQILECM